MLDSGVDGRILQAEKLLEQLCKQLALKFPADAQSAMPAGPVAAASILAEASQVKQVTSCRSGMPES